MFKDEMLNILRKPIPKRTKEEINNLVIDLMSKMTLKEKIGQMYQTGHEGTEVTGPQFDASKTVKNVKDIFKGKGKLSDSVNSTRSYFT